MNQQHHYPPQAPYGQHAPAPPPERPVKVSEGNAISALFAMIGRDIADLLRNPLAFVGGLAGMLLSTALLGFAFIVVVPNANASDEDGEDDEEFEIDFEPGALVKLGAKIEEKELPEKIIVAETREEEASVEQTDTITDEDVAKPKDPDKPEPSDDPKKDVPPPKEQKDKKLPTSKIPTKKNTPYDDLPTVQVDKGDPFGDPGGWADRAKDGDPWATEVMKSLNNMAVGTFAAKGKPGDFKFQLTICKDGTIKKVDKKGGSLAQDGQDAVRLALEQLEIPKPPSDVASKMKSNCAKIKYTFVWSTGKVK